MAAEIIPFPGQPPPPRPQRQQRKGKQAGGRPPAFADFCDEKLDLNRELLRNPAETFFVRVAGDSMINAGIHPGDLLIVDCALKAESGQIVIARIGTELAVKLVRFDDDGMWLSPANPDYRPLRVAQSEDVEVWGVVTFVIHACVPLAAADEWPDVIETGDER
jgi:DNA polymerase V